MLHKNQPFSHSSIHQLKFFCLLLVLPCMALECNPDKDEEEKPTYYMSEEFKDYVLFPEGSWWVYQNQDGQTDTLKIIWQESTITDQHNFNSKVEWFQHHLKSTFYKDTLYGGGKARFEGGDPMAYNRGLSYLFFTSKDTGKIYYHSVKEVKFISKVKKVKIGNNFYDTIKIFKIFKKRYSSQPQRVYWSKNVGIIKKVLFDSTVWKLKDYHINN